MKFCHSCYKEYSDDVNKCPYCGKRQQKPNWILAVICSIFFLFVAYAFISSQLEKISPEERAAKDAKYAEKEVVKAEERRKQDCSDTNSAFIMSQTFVKESLKAPSTAKFPYMTDSNDIGAVITGDCKFEVYSYVDAQNGFGAMIRSRYTINMEYRPKDNTWSGSNLKMQ